MTETTREDDLRQMLMARLREVEGDVQARLRVGRTRPVHEGGDHLEHSDTHTQADIDLILIQMRAVTLARIGEVLVKLDAGEYGVCRTCAGQIAERRLRALPFAVRCRACEDRLERESARVKRPQYGPQGDSLFFDLAEI